MAEWYWKRKDIYRDDNGKCVYADECGECTEKCDPEHCDTFDHFFDEEVLADDILMNS